MIAYNHGRFGPANARPDMTKFSNYSTDTIYFTGLNQLYGDGSVHWRNQTETPPTLAGLTANLGYVLGAGTSRTWYFK